MVHVNGGAREQFTCASMSCDVVLSSDLTHELGFGHEISCDAPPTKRQCSRGADLLTLSEYCINKHFTWVQVTGHCRCESTNAGCILPGTHYSVDSHTYCRFDSNKIVTTV